MGKTQLCLSLTVSALAGREQPRGLVLYIDTENKFSAERCGRGPRPPVPLRCPTPRLFPRASLLQLARARLPETFSDPARLEQLARAVFVLSASSRAELEQRCGRGGVFAPWPPPAPTRSRAQHGRH